MSTYLSYKFEDTPGFVNTYDELPLWSASFGLMLLEHLEYRTGLTILDIGSGTGFPLMEIASRFGSSCTCYGLDIWKNANNRAKEKTKNYGLDNVEIIEGSAANIPLGDNSVDRIVSNLGINNFDQPAIVFRECNRVLKPGGKLALTTNLYGHWKEFYNIFEHTLKGLGKHEAVSLLEQQQVARGTVSSVSSLFTDNGFKVTRTFEDSFEMKFADGSAFLNHHFVKLGWLASWKTLVKEEEMVQVFAQLEQDLDEYAAHHNGLSLTVPMAFVEGEK